MKHGGDLAEAIRAFGAPQGEWLDLSTGINPFAFDYSAVEAAAWQRLPQSDRLTMLLQQALFTYAASCDAPILAAPGTQILIQLLPLVRPASRVAIVGPTYSEHASVWQRAGAQVEIIDDLLSPSDAEVIILVNPNNPDGRSWSAVDVRACAVELAMRDGLLVVDEAFADLTPEISVASYAGAKGLIVLRSFGKFFGLAGLRLGFALGPQDLIEALRTLLGPWAVSGPAIEIGIQALNDLEWQRTTRSRLDALAARLDTVLTGAGFTIIGGTSLYRLAMHPHAWDIHGGLAQQRIWARFFDDHPHWLRFGLPGGDADFERLAAAFRSLGLSRYGKNRIR